jgi:hypothetical protein
VVSTERDGPCSLAPSANAVWDEADGGLPGRTGHERSYQPGANELRPANRVSLVTPVTSSRVSFVGNMNLQSGRRAGPAEAQFSAAIGRPLAIAVLRNCALVDVIAQPSELIATPRTGLSLGRSFTTGGGRSTTVCWVSALRASRSR